jgi:predicted nucleic acid-binding protein
VRVYLDTSAASKLIVREPESVVLIEYLDAAVAAGVDLVSSLLLETELRRVAIRLELPQVAVSDVLDRVQLAFPDKLLYRDAGLLSGANLRSLDALHVAAALRLEAREFITYDRVQAKAANNHGLKTVAPAAGDVNH